MKAMIAILGLAIAAPAAAQEMAPQPVTTATPDAARLAIATRIAADVFPDGTYKRLMSGTFDQIISSAFDSVGDLPMREIALAMGAKPEDIPNFQPGAMKEVMLIIDPAYKERATLGMKAMFASMADMFVKFEPSMRDGLAEAYANRFDLAQLSDLEAFFNSPTGKRYAAESMLLYTDPAVMKRMTALMPEMMKDMPKFIGAMTEATKNLPKQRKYGDLTKEEKARIATLLGLDAKHAK